jgi:hypothetical protein
MRVLVRCFLVGGLLCVAAAANAQRPAATPALPSLSADQQAALDQLSAQYAGDLEIHQAWYRDRQVMYYGFGVSPRPVAVGRVLWPIHGFDLQGNPVAIRGQRPIFSTLPGLPGYSGIFRLAYVITADRVQPNTIRDIASAEALVRRGRARLQETNVTYNLPITPQGTRLPRDSTAPMLGWYQGRDVQFFDFGQSAVATAPMMAFVTGMHASGDPEFLRAQFPVIDSLPVSSPYPDFWEVRYVTVDSAYSPNALKGLAAVTSSGYLIEPTPTIRNGPVMFVDGARVPRTPSPLTTFADLRSPFPPSPTVLKVP